MRNQIGGVVALIALLVGGCSSTLESRDGTRGGVGAAYMAPMRMLNLVATRGPAAIEPTQTQVRNAQAAFVAASSAATTATNNEATARAEALAARAAVNALLATDPEAVRTTMTTAAAKEEGELTTAQAVLRVAQGELLTARANLEALVRASDASTQWRETIDVSMGPARGDPEATFVADINDSFFRSAAGNIKITGGLLQSSDVTTTGEVGNILTSTAGSLAALVTAGGRIYGEGAEGSSTLSCVNSELIVQPLPIDAGPQSLNLTFNPSNPRDVRSVNYSLCRAGFSHRVFVTPPTPVRNAILSGAREREVGRAGDAAMRAENAAQRAEAAAVRITEAEERAREEAQGAQPTQQQREVSLRAELEIGTGLRLNSLAGEPPPPPSLECRGGACPGLVYRQPQPWAVHVVRLDPDCNPARCTAQHLPFVERTWRFDLPNGAPLQVLPYNTSWFVARRDTVTFVDGSLQSHDFNHPSEAATAARVPGAIVDAVFSSISRVLELRVALTNDERDLSNAERDYQTAIADRGNDEVTRLQHLESILKLELSIANLRQQIDTLEADAPVSQ